MKSKKNVILIGMMGAGKSILFSKKITINSTTKTNDILIASFKTILDLL